MKELIDLQRALHVPKDKEGHKYMYRKVDDILKAVKLIAPENVYIILTDEVINVGNSNYIKSTATINNGKESISTSSSAKEGQLPGQSDPQMSGSSATYARKRALDGLFALDDNDDDPDGIVVKPINKGTDPNPEPVTVYQLAILKDYMAGFVKENKTEAAKHLTVHMTNKSLTKKQAENVISDIKKYLGVK